MRKWNHANFILRSRLRENGRSFHRPFREWPNDKTIIELGYRKISWFVSISQVNYLPVHYFTSYLPEEQEASLSRSDWSSCSAVSCSDVASSSTSSGSLIASSASVLLRYPEATKRKIGYVNSTYSYGNLFQKCHFVRCRLSVSYHENV